MRKIGYTGRYIRILSYMMAVFSAFLQPCSILAAEISPKEEVPQPEETAEPEEGTQSEETEPEGGSQSEEITEPGTDSTNVVKYIVAFEALAEEDAYLPCMYKPTLEELQGVLPETLQVWLDEEEEPVELTVAWECEADFDAVEQLYYLFYPKWDETQYAIAESVEGSIEVPVITVEVSQTGGILKNPEEAKDSLYFIIQKKAVLASIYLCDEYEVKVEPSSDSESVHTVVSGQAVQIMDVEADEYGGIWYRVLLYQNGTEYTGYVEKDYLATSDEDFAEWEETYLDLSAIPMVMALSEGCPDIDQFPASYQNALYALKEKHPDWTFVRMDTGLDWNTAIANELGDKSWIPSSRSGSWQNGNASQPGWSYASEGILKYYMDPRNFLDDSHIFQFEMLIYNSSYHTTDAVQGILAGSFMASAIPNDGRTYAQAFATIGQELGVSPFHLASRVLQEQGTRGSSALISGTYPGYEGYYNYFNISASGNGDAETIRRGLAKARMEGWNTRYSSLYGGAKIIGSQYILWGQDTLYLEKFNVTNGKYANYTHQYMQNIEAPYYEASNIYKAYQKAGVLERRFVFKIPVYENMPASACAQPEKTDAITLDKTGISSLEVDKSITLVPYVNGSKVDHVNDMTFTSSNPAVAVVDAQGKITALSPGDTTIICTRSGASSAKCAVTVVKANPAVSTPVLSPVTYRESLSLADVALPSGWVWVNGDTTLSVGTSAYAAVYTPTDTTKYNTITKNVSFTVTKAVPACQVPTDLEVESGAALGSIALPDGFLWESNAETVLTDAGEYTFYVSYNPDENNYYTVNHIPVIVQVKETAAEQPSGGNGSGNGGSSSGGTGTGTGNGNNGSIGSGNSSTSTGSTQSPTSVGSTSTGSAQPSTSAGSTSAGSTQPPTSAGSTSTGSTQPPTSAGSTSAGSTQPPTSVGSTSTGSTQPPTSAGSTSTGSTQPPTSAGSTSAGSTQPPTSVGSTSTGSTQPPTSSGSAAEGNQQPPASPGNAQTGNTEPSASDNNVQTGNNIPSDNTTVESTQPSAPEVTAPTENDRPAAAPAMGASTESANDQVVNSNISTVINENDTNDIRENSSPVEEVESAGQSEDPNYFRPAVTIQMEDTTILTTEKIQMAKEQNFDLLLDMGGAVTWSIDVDSIDEAAMTEVDMGVALGTNNVPQELISTILNGNKYLEITLAHQGEFGFEPVLNVALGKEYSGKYANLFYYDPETETLEFICDAVIGPDGVASLRFEHASCYLIVVSDESMSGVSFEDETVNPVTRWIMAGVFVCMLSVVVGYGIFFFIKKRKEEADEEDEDENDDGDVEEERDDEPYEAYEEKRKPERHFQTFDLMSAEADEGHERKRSEQKGLRINGKGHTKPAAEEYAQEEISQRSWNENVAESEDDEYFDEDDWIEDDDWQEPESDVKSFENACADTPAEDDWIDDDEGNAEDDWIEDDEWVE